MIPEPGQHVKCFMRSTMALEGIVENWTTTEVILKSLDGQSIMIIHCPTEDIIMTKIVLKTFEKIKEKKEIVEKKKDQIREKLHEVLQPSGDAKLDQMNIKQLHNLVIQQDKKIIQEKIKEHFSSPYSSDKTSKYSVPSGFSRR